MKKQNKIVIGDIVKIKLDDVFHTYARVLPETHYAFYDCRISNEIDIKDICSKPILFITAAHSTAVKEGKWAIIGNLPLESNLQVIPPKFIRSNADPNEFFILDN
jgi:hypothetical protein